MPAMTIERVGYGAGMRDNPGTPNVLRILIGAVRGRRAAASSGVVVIECEIDDMNPQLFGPSMERLYAAGALEVFYVPVADEEEPPGHAADRRRAAGRSARRSRTSSSARRRPSACGTTRSSASAWSARSSRSTPRSGRSASSWPRATGGSSTPRRSSRTAPRSRARKHAGEGRPGPGAPGLRRAGNRAANGTLSKLP